MNGFRREAEDYISMRRALGFKFALQGRLVIEFVGYLDDSGPTRLTTAAALAWATKPAGPTRPGGTSACRWHEVSPATCTTSTRPPRCRHRPLLSGRFRRATPYLYSPADIDALMAATAVCATRFDGPPTTP